MNGEFLNDVLCALTAKHFLRTGVFVPVEREYVEGGAFVFATDDPAAVPVVSWDEAVFNWVNRLRDAGTSDVWFFGQWAGQSLHVLGFVGGAGNRRAVAAKSPTGSSAWTANWTFDRNAKQWVVRYYEAVQPTPLPVLQLDPSVEFLDTLTGLEDLARRIGFNAFATLFAEAAQFLTDASVPVAGPASMPVRYHRLWAAAQRSWVFGAMGSWNDSPPFAAREAGLEAVYDELSARLYRNIIEASSLAVNGW